MAKIFGVSGVQGCGKSTLLEGLKQYFSVDDFKVARKAQEMLGWENLNRVKDSPTAMRHFQEMILRMKIEREDQNLKLPQTAVVLTERTFADIFAYTALWVEQFKSDGKWDLTDSKWLEAFYEKCVDAQQKFFAGVIFVSPSEHVKFEHDPNRASEDTRDFINTCLKRFVFDVVFIDKPKVTITEDTVQGRVQEAKTSLVKIVNGEFNYA